MIKKIQETKLHAVPHFPAGSSAVHIGDHLRSNLGIISGLGIICGRGSFAALYSSEHLATTSPWVILSECEREL